MVIYNPYKKQDNMADCDIQAHANLCRLLRLTEMTMCI